jgi:hypothetical protein
MEIPAFLRVGAVFWASFAVVLLWAARTIWPKDRSLAVTVGLMAVGPALFTMSGALHVSRRVAAVTLVAGVVIGVYVSRRLRRLLQAERTARDSITS